MSSIENGLAVLARFTDENTVLSQGEVARLTGLPRSTAHGCLFTLSALGYLVQTRERRYRLPGGDSARLAHPRRRRADRRAA